MARLTERFSNGQAAVAGCGNNCKYNYKYCKFNEANCPTLDEIYEKLAFYEDLEEKGEAERYIFGFEESYGCLCGSYARDKDGVVATMLICEMAAFYKEKNMTLYDAVQKLYEEFGYFRELQKALTLEGMSGLKKIKNMMSFIKENPFTEMNGQKVVALTDISKGEKLDLISGKREKINLPGSDVLIFELEDETKFIVRPSGTEPKIKFYFFVCGETAKEADELMNSLSGAVLEQVDKLM